MNVNETIAKLAMIGLKGKFQTTGHADYARVYVLDAAGVTLGRISIFQGAYSHIKWYSGIIEAYNIDQRRPTLAWNMLLQSNEVLTDTMWSSIKHQAQVMQQAETRQAGRKFAGKSANNGQHYLCVITETDVHMTSAERAVNVRTKMLMIDQKEVFPFDHPLPAAQFKEEFLRWIE